MIIVYNKPLTQAYKAAPGSRKDVLDLARAHPDLKGRITIFDPTGNSTALGALWKLTKERPDAWPLFEEIGPFLRPERSAGTVREKVTSGEYVMALMSSGAGIPQYEQPAVKAIVGWDFPADGVPIAMRHVALTKAARHPAAARVFLDLLLSKAGQIALAQGGQTPYRDDIGKDEAPFETYGSIRDKVGEEDMILIPPDAALAGERDAFIARWQKAIGR
jgi:iron(III) transport system substrate-binding protein